MTCTDMGDPKSSLISADDFFRYHYRPLADASADLAFALTAGRNAEHCPFPLDVIFARLQIILASIFSVLRVDHRVSIPSIEDISASVAALIPIVARCVDADDAVIKIKDAAPALARHNDYFTERFNPRRDHDGIGFVSNDKKTIFLEYIFNVTTVVLRNITDGFKFRCADPRKTTEFFDPVDTRDACPSTSRAIIQSSATSLQGWCSEAKTWLLYNLVRETKPETAVEIGVYGGRSLIPIAQGLKDNSHGTVIGIEAWKASTATRFSTSIANDFWWQWIDLFDLKERLTDFIAQNRLSKTINLVEMSAETAHFGISEIDFLHIDGNHSVFGSANDVINYFPKLKTGGILIFDDIDWGSTHPALDIVMSASELIHVVPLEDRPNIPSCAAFRKV